MWLPNTAVQQVAKGDITTDLRVSVDSQAAALAWLEGALKYARTQGQEKLVGYLEAVVEDVIFEMEMAIRRRRLLLGKKPALDSD